MSSRDPPFSILFRGRYSVERTTQTRRTTLIRLACDQPANQFASGSLTIPSRPGLAARDSQLTGHGAIAQEEGASCARDNKIGVPCVRSFVREAIATCGPHEMATQFGAKFKFANLMHKRIFRTLRTFHCMSRPEMGICASGHFYSQWQREIKTNQLQITRFHLDFDAILKIMISSIFIFLI